MRQFRNPSLIVSCLATACATLPIGCQQRSTTSSNERAVAIITVRGPEAVSEVEPSHDRVDLPETAPLESPGLSLVEHAQAWAPRLLLVEPRNGGVTISGEGDLVEVAIPCRLRMDENLVSSWTEQLRESEDLVGATPQSRRLLTRAATSASRSTAVPSSDCGGPVMSMQTLDLAISDGPETFGLIIADRSGWGASAKVFRLRRGAQLVELLHGLTAPRAVELLAIADDEVVHGSSLPLLPTAYNGVGRPQPMASPWWIRNRRDSLNERPVWRNAQSWLAPNRTLATAMAEVPETVGDLLFIPMLGWRSDALAPEFAVGWIDLTIRLTLPRELATSIDRFEFRVADWAN